MQASPASPLSQPLPTHLALLPGRTEWLHLCHENPADCDDCLGRVAAFLARELEYNLNRALDKTSLSYRAELGPHVCTLERAGVLRRLTAQHCLPVRSMLGEHLRHAIAWSAERSAAAEGAAYRPREGQLLTLQAAAAAEPIIADGPEYYCEISGQWEQTRCDHASCQPNDMDRWKSRGLVVGFPAKAATKLETETGDEAAVWWKQCGMWLLGAVLLPVTLAIGGAYLMVMVAALLFGADVEMGD